MSVEQLNQPEQFSRPRPANEIFASKEQTFQAVEHALQDGTITTEWVAGYDDNPDLTPAIQISQQDINVSRLSEDEREGVDSGYWWFGQMQDTPLKDPQGAAEKAQGIVHQELVDKIAEDSTWHLQDPEIAADAEQGTVSEAFQINIGDGRQLPIINFSEIKLSAEQQQQIKDIMTKVADLSGGRIMDRLKGVFIQKPEHFKANAKGKPGLGAATSFDGKGVIRLNDILLTGQQDEYFRTEKHGDLANPLEATLTHELGHIIEGADPEYNAYADALGWNYEGRRAQNDTLDNAKDPRHDIVNKTVATLERPHLAKVSLPDGSLKEVNINEHFGKAAVDAAKPVTEYAYTNHMEDAAEAFVRYVHAPNDPSQLDAVRANALQGMLRRGAGDLHGPFNGQIERLSLDDLQIGATIQPAHLKIMEPQFRLEESGRQMANQKTNAPLYYDSSEQITDDYGNRVEGHRRVMQ